MRTMKYLQFEAAERFGQDPFAWFPSLSWRQQLDVLVYTSIRQQEMTGCPLTSKG